MKQPPNVEGNTPHFLQGRFLSIKLCPTECRAQRLFFIDSDPRDDPSNTFAELGGGGDGPTAVIVG